MITGLIIWLCIIIIVLFINYCKSQFKIGYYETTLEFLDCDIKEIKTMTFIKMLRSRSND